MWFIYHLLQIQIDLNVIDDTNNRFMIHLIAMCEVSTSRCVTIELVIIAGDKWN